MAEANSNRYDPSYLLNDSTNIRIIKPEFSTIQIGQRFSRLCVLGNEFMLKRGGSNHNRRVIVACDCGTVKIIDVADLTRRKNHSCGCLHKEIARAVCNSRNHIHGKSKTPIYAAWKDMMRRCHKTDHHQFVDYGARGIEVCEEWRSDFLAFHDWSMRNGWQSGLSIDRIDNNSGYRPDNCRWATKLQQTNNMRSNRLITFENETKTFMQWCRDPRCLVGKETLRGRLSRGWDFGKAIATVADSRFASRA